VLRDYAELCDRELDGLEVQNSEHRKQVLRRMMKPLLGIFRAEPGTNLWRRKIDHILQRDGDPGSALELIHEASSHIPDSIMDLPPETPDVVEMDLEPESLGLIRLEE